MRTDLDGFTFAILYIAACGSIGGSIGWWVGTGAISFAALAFALGLIMLLALIWQAYRRLSGTYRREGR